MSKLIFLESQPLHAYLERNLGVEQLLRIGFDVEFIDIGHTLDQARWLTGVELPPPVHITSTAYDKLEDLQYRLRCMGPDVCIVNNVGYQPGWVHRSGLVWQELWRSKAVLGVAAASVMSGQRISKVQSMNNVLANQTHNHPNLVKRIALNLSPIAKNQKLSQLADFPDFSFTGKNRDYRPVDFLWGSVAPARSSMALLGGKTRHRVLHTFNAEAALYLQTPPVELSRPYIVFLDSMGGGIHPDFGHNGYDFTTINPERYYEDLATLFRTIQKSYGLPIIVAAHPKLSVELAAKYFPESMLLHENTAGLVAGSEFVIAEPSSSIDFVAWFAKPLLMIKTIDSPGWVNEISDSYASQLGCPTVVLEAAEGSIPRPTINRSLAAAFVRKWMKYQKSEQRPFWAAVTDDLRNGPL